MTRKPDAFLPLPEHVSFILIALLGEIKHGYAIMQEINLRAGKDMLVGPASLYRALRDLCNSGLIRETDSPLVDGRDDARRRYYVITEFGERVLKAEGHRMRAILRLLDIKMR